MIDNTNEILLLQIKDMLKVLEESGKLLYESLMEDYTSLEKRISKLEAIISTGTLKT